MQILFPRKKYETSLVLTIFNTFKLTTKTMILFFQDASLTKIDTDNEENSITIIIIVAVKKIRKKIMRK